MIGHVPNDALGECAGVGGGPDQDRRMHMGDHVNESNLAGACPPADVFSGSGVRLLEVQ